MQLPQILQPRCLDGPSGQSRQFMPSAQEIYPKSTHLTFNFGALENCMEGIFRPGHFHGVALVVAKLFNLVTPHIAYFGQKDFQQYLIISHLTETLFFDIQIRCMPIIRKENGLAMSSRNRRLSLAGQSKAAILFNSLTLASELLREKKSISLIREKVKENFSKAELELEYIEFIDVDNISKPVDNHTSNVAICIAAYVEGVRLIDNTLLTL